MNRSGYSRNQRDSGGQRGQRDNRGSGGNHRDNDRSGSRQSNTLIDGGALLDLDGNPLTLPPSARLFEELTSIDPTPRLTLEYPGCPASCRLIDLFCPIGRGQRGMIVSPPKAGKTTLLKDIGTALLRNHPDIELVLLLIDERPEEVTDFRRHFAIGTTSPGAHTPVRVIASSNDHTTEKHIELAITTIARAKNMVRAGKHVVILLDSLTRLGRAFNQSRKHASSGRTLSGGLDSKALEVPRALFGAARNTEPSEGGGSLTIIASCLVDTGSQADQVIFEEFKGSGNMELILDRSVAEKRLFPAMNLAASGTRKDNLLLGAKELETINALRRQLLTMQPPVQVERLVAAINRTPSNAALLGV
jgi:transcription termination factor Rho